MLLIAAFVPACLPADGAYAEEAPETVFFGSRLVEAEIRKIIAKPSGDIFRSELEEITSITLSNVKDPMRSGQFIDLTGLGLLPDLTALSLNIMDSCTLQNIEVLRRLPRLTALHIQQLQPTYYALKDLNLFSNMKNLRELPLLEELNLTGNGAEDVSPLQKNYQIGTNCWLQYIKITQDALKHCRGTS